MLPAKERVNNIEEFLIAIFVFTDQVGVVVSFGLSDQIIYVATHLHEDVTMDGYPHFPPESLSSASELLGFSYISGVPLSLRPDIQGIRNLLR